MAIRVLAGACACMSLFTVAAHAAEIPKGAFQRPLRVIVPFPPGGGQDTLARLVGAKLSEVVGQQVIVDNRPGGGGIIASEATLKAPPDGHTMYIVSISFVVTPSLQKSLPYDTIKDFAPIVRISSSPGTMVVHPSLPVRSVREFVKLAKSRPGQITFGSSGIASGSHLAGELLKVMTGIDIVHVPYKGSGQVSTALYSGEIVLGFPNVVAALPHVRASRLKALGVTTAKRSALLPDVPTIAESGVPGFESTIWSGVVVSSATPRPMQSALHDAILRTFESHEIKDKLARDGAEPFIGDNPREYAAFIASEIAKWAKVVRHAGVQPQ